MKLKKIAAAAASLAVMAATTMSLSGSAVTTVRDPDGDGRILVSDGSFILQYLAGNFNPTSQRSLDFDGNGIISNKDATVLAHYWMKLINGSSFDDINLPAPVGADTQAVATTREYVRYYYNNSVSNPVTQYSLTVDPYDNTNTSPNANSQQRVVIGENDMEIDSDTAIVYLAMSNSGIGTGFIVDKHIIATAGHCVRGTSKFYNLGIELIDAEGKSQIIHPVYVDVPKIYVDERNADYDYALIYVKEDLSKYGILQMGVALDKYVNEHNEVTVSGFPTEYPSDYSDYAYYPFGIRFKATGKIIKTNESGLRLHYDADTASGDSGGPVYAHEEFSSNDYNTVIAIHTRREPGKEENSGVRITPDILKFFLNNSNIDY